MFAARITRGGRSNTRRSFDPEGAVRSGLRLSQAPGILRGGPDTATGGRDREGRAVVMVNRVMARPVQGPEQVFLKPVAVAVIGNHLGVLVQRLGNARDMGQAGQNGPATSDKHRSAVMIRPASVCPVRVTKACPKLLRHACGAVLFYPPLGDSMLLCQNRTCMQPTPP